MQAKCLVEICPSQNNAARQVFLQQIGTLFGLPAWASFNEVKINEINVCLEVQVKHRS